MKNQDYNAALRLDKIDSISRRHQISLLEFYAGMALCGACADPNASDSDAISRFAWESARQMIENHPDVPQE